MLRTLKLIITASDFSQDTESSRTKYYLNIPFGYLKSSSELTDPKDKA
jgi:hypothetical protein